MKKHLRKGGGELLGFSIGLVLFLWILSFFVGLIITENALNDMEYAVIMASRKAIVCDSMDNAKEESGKIVQEIMARNHAVSNIQVDIRYTPGSEQEWKKGNYIDVAVLGEIHTSNPLLNDYRHVKETIMIEHHG